MRKVQFVPENDIDYESYAVLEDDKLVGRLRRLKKKTYAKDLLNLLLMNQRRYWTMSLSLNGHTGGQGRKWLSKQQARSWITSRIVGRPQK